MNLNELKKNWNQFGKEDPYWAILTDPDKKGNRWEEKEFFETGRLLIDKKFKRLKNLNPNFSFHSALDFGCGAGRLTQGLANHFDKAVGVDIAPSMIQLAKEKNNKKNCTFIVNDKNDLSIFGKEEFDFIYSVITLQHMQPIYAKSYIIEFLRLLKPNGIAMFQVPSKPNKGTLEYHDALSKPEKGKFGFLSRFSKNNTLPIMEMYWIPIKEMVAFLVDNNAEILRIVSNDAAGDEWDSYTYIVSIIK